MFSAIISVLIGLYLLLVLILYSTQESFIFFPTHLPQDYEFKYFENFEERFFDLDAITQLHALHFKTKKPKGIILYFHGNARSNDDWGYAATDFTQHEYEVFMPDYRTYGKSTGKLSEAALNSDALLLYNELLKMYKESEIVLFGRSLGTGIAVELATKTNPKLLILETPYLSLTKLASKDMPFVPISLLMKYQFKNEDKLTDINCPIHIFHGTDDLQIPFEHATEFAIQYGKAGVLTTIDGGGHNNLSDFEEYREKMKELLE